ncbi:AraC family transcriptional regulator [Maritimibacter dapengensis]|uniref:Helix-turn-helix domain-containing protein n=1 Tax=Maritimibacter dapengensis TaxID=2836868 RepID=A0ABS6T210_9RHOB|nr:helix-turn-helix domain-containing protein [Maritimibacter dapengensis]MBV7379268.1 helix-turn-helix domain-containing protein [Maritimibacter dapengensis]
MPDPAQLFLPPPALSGCVFAAIGRDTRGLNLRHADRFNHFPASPLCALNIVMQGETRMVASGTRPEDAPVLARVTLSGPQSAPVTSWSPGEVVALSIGLYPDAVARLTGVDVVALADRTVTDVPAPLDRVALAVLGVAEPAAGWLRAANALQALWAQERDARAEGATARIGDWARDVATRAALSGPGTSLRAIERRLKRLSGASRRTLDHFARIEALQARVTRDRDAPLAALAHDAGFSDQSHMGRALRRTTGFSPAQINRLIETEEPFWAYRLMGERF